MKSKLDKKNCNLAPINNRQKQANGVLNEEDQYDLFPSWRRSLTLYANLALHERLQETSQLEM